MKIADIMTTDVRSCHPETNLADVAESMWEYDCGALPVVDGEGRVVGMITDRDVCLAVGTNDRRPSEMKVAEVIGKEVWACEEGDNVRGALDVMEQKKVRRLPVVDEENRLVGIISMNDIVLNAIEKIERTKGNPWQLSYEDAMAALKLISAHRDLPVPHPAGKERQQRTSTAARVEG